MYKIKFFNNFRLSEEKEDFERLGSYIERGIALKGTNLWILIFAIFIASLGLNVNSTAVIIGAMLVSPLMGPIMGLAFGIAFNDLELLKRSFYSYLLAGSVALATSTLFFLISPINDAHSEILARTSPNIYDVLIAFFGGLAGILATSSKLKGNVIPGVAIATALMPPLCTAGYGLATLQFSFFFGAFYLFIINTVFIALATLVTTRFLKFPYKQLPKREDEIKAKGIVGIVVMITLLPSVYFGYDLVQQNKFMQKANQFIKNEANFPNDYLLKKDIDTKIKKITLVYGGKAIKENEIAKLKSKLSVYNLQNTTLEIRQGFAYLENNKENEQASQLNLALLQREKQMQVLQSKLDSVTFQNERNLQVFSELKIQYPNITSCLLQPLLKSLNKTDTTQQILWIANIQLNKKLSTHDQKKIKDWLKVRMDNQQIKVYFKE